MESELSTATNVPVKLGDRSYEIVIAPGALDEVASTIAATVSTSHLLVVSDSNVAPKGKKGTQPIAFGTGFANRKLFRHWPG